jgi:hypothetical protein
MTMAPPRTIDHERVIALFRAGHTPISIAQDFGVSDAWIRRLLRRAGFKPCDARRGFSLDNARPEVREVLEPARVAGIGLPALAAKAGYTTRHLQHIAGGRTGASPFCLQAIRQAVEAIKQGEKR